MAPALVWADEFDDPVGTRPDPSRWAFDIGGTGWGNRQLEYYTDSNAATDGDGHLLITSQPLDVTAAPSCWYGACHFVSSRLTTAGIASWQYGRFEIRAAFPIGEATWPAFWMLGADFAEVGWPASGEIDVVEHVGRDGNVVRGTAHGPGYSAHEGVTGAVDVGSHQEFHTYAVEWGPTSIVWFVDGNEYHRLDRSDDRQWVFDHEFYLVLNLAIGGLLGGEPGPIDFEVQTLAVDWVRVYAP
ncbi:MAG TPA: glycoside hydrolase family 16 protein [Ilumatobacteraceae bacterium]|nr:glycoside hydrolase family 16 protein [Ilumatobacteraceae bacterium]